MKVQGYKGKFVKKNGDEREMLFVELGDLPAKLLSEHTKGTGKQAKLPGNQRLVWDVEAKNFRVFNFGTLVDRLQNISVDL